MKWNEEKIRTELKRLDEITGFQASELPIRIDDDYRDEFIAAYLVCNGEPYKPQYVYQQYIYLGNLPMQ